MISIVLLLLLGHATGAKSQGRREIIKGAPTCANCTIRLDSVVVLRVKATEGHLRPRWRIARDRWGRWYTAGGPNGFQIFAKSGEYLRVGARSGRGPGEYQRAATPEFIGDTMYIYDYANARLSVLDSAGRFVRATTISVLGLSVLPNGQLLENLDAIWPSRPTPIRLFDRHGKLVRTLATAAAGGVVMTKGRGNYAWLASNKQYVIQRIDLAGRANVSFVRSIDWFPDDYRYADPFEGNEPNPSVVAVHEDSEGLLWVMIQVADSDWRNGVKRYRAAGKDGEPPVRGWTDGIYDTIVEVIDVRAGKVIVSQRFGDRFPGFDAEGFVHRYYENEDGLPEMPIFRPVIVGLPTNHR